MCTGVFPNPCTVTVTHTQAPRPASSGKRRLKRQRGTAVSPVGRQNPGELTADTEEDKGQQELTRRWAAGGMRTRSRCGGQPALLADVNARAPPLPQARSSVSPKGAETYFHAKRFTTDKTWKLPRCPQQVTDVLRLIHTVGQSSGLKKETSCLARRTCVGTWNASDKVKEASLNGLHPG